MKSLFNVFLVLSFCVGLLSGCEQSETKKTEGLQQINGESFQKLNATPRFKLLKEAPQLKGFKKEDICLAEAIDYSDFRYGVYEKCGRQSTVHDYTYLVDIDNKKIIKSVDYPHMGARSYAFGKPFGNLLAIYGYSDFDYKSSGIEFLNLATGESVYVISGETFKVIPTKSGDILLATGTKKTGSEFPSNPKTKYEFQISKISKDRVEKNIAKFNLEMDTSSRDDRMYIAGGTEDSLIIYQRSYGPQDALRSYRVDPFTGKIIQDLVSISQAPGFFNEMYNRFLVYQPGFYPTEFEVFDFASGKSCTLKANDLRANDSSFDALSSPTLTSQKKLVMGLNKTDQKSELSIYDLTTCQKVADYGSFHFMTPYETLLFGTEGFYLKEDFKAGDLSLISLDGTLLDTFHVELSRDSYYPAQYSTRTFVIGDRKLGISRIYGF